MKIIISVLLMLSFITFAIADVCINGNCKNGEGAIQYDRGAVYEGQCKNGLPHGKGVLYDTDGCIFRGTFFKGYAHGWADVQCPDVSFRGLYRYGSLVR